MCIVDIQIQSFQLLLTELSSQSEDLPLPDATYDVLVLRYYENRDGNLIPLRGGRFRTMPYGEYRVGVIINRRVCPFFDTKGRMVIVDRVTRTVLPIIPDHVNIARRFRFVNPHRRRLIPETK